MKIFIGDVTKVENSFICHQVTCVGIMQDGVAGALKSKYPIRNPQGRPAPTLRSMEIVDTFKVAKTAVQVE